VTVSLVVSGFVGISIACLVLAKAVAAAHRDRTLARIRRAVAADDERPETNLQGAHPLRGQLLHVMAAAGGGVMGLWLAGPVGALAGIVGAEGVRRAVRSRNQRANRDRLDLQLAETIVTISSAVRAGLSVRRALEEAHRGSEPPLRDPLARVIDRLGVGQEIDSSLEMFAREIDSPDGRLITTLLGIHRRTGGNLPALLDDVAGVIGQRAETRRQVRALTAQGRASGAVLAVLPIAFVGLLSWTSGDGLGAYYRTTPGAVLLLSGLVCDLLGFLWIRQIVWSERA
jgi:tight adherence protein B